MSKALVNRFIQNKENAVLLGNIIRVNRMEQNISMEALANYSNVARSYLSQVERGVRSAAPNTYKVIFNQLDIDFRILNMEDIKVNFEKVLKAINYSDPKSADRLMNEHFSNDTKFSHSNAILETYIIRYVYFVNKLRGKWNSEFFLLESIVDEIKESLIVDYRIIFGQYNAIRYYHDNDFQLAIRTMVDIEHYGISRHTPMIDYQKGYIYTLMKKPVHAIMALTKCKPYFDKQMNYHKSIGVRINLGINYAVIGDYKLAERHYLEVLEHCEKMNLGSYKSMVYTNLASMLVSMENYSKAFDYLDMTLNLETPSLPTIYTALSALVDYKSEAQVTTWKEVARAHYSNNEVVVMLLDLIETDIENADFDTVNQKFLNMISALERNMPYVSYEAIVLDYVKFLENNRRYKEALKYQKELFQNIRKKRYD